MDAEGQVSVKRGKEAWAGEKIHYNFKTGLIETGRFRTGQEPFYASGENLAGDRSNHVYTATNAVITTDNYAEPSYKIRARELTLPR